MQQSVPINLLPEWASEPVQEELSWGGDFSILCVVQMQNVNVKSSSPWLLAAPIKTLLNAVGLICHLLGMT